jgi:hypothetical protein
VAETENRDCVRFGDSVRGSISSQPLTTRFVPRSFAAAVAVPVPAAAIVAVAVGVPVAVAVAVAVPDLRLT